MTFILLPVHNESKRLPSKQFMLLPFTLSWLQHEMQMQGDGVRVCTYGYLDEKNLLRLRSISEAVEHLQLTPDEDKGHFEATQNAIRKLSPAETDFLILLQSTQPLRRVGLLQDTLTKLAEIPSQSVVSASLVQVQGRQLSHQGTLLPDAPDVFLYDGAIYGGTLATWMDWWSMQEKSHQVVINQTYSVCDIDTPADVLKHIIWK